MTPHELALSLDQFYTRPALAKAVVEWADIQPEAKVLEPSCGAGNLVRWMPPGVELTMVDIDQGNVDRCMGDVIQASTVKNVTGRCSDFLALKYPSDAFDIAVMNPPYGYVGEGKQRRAADRLHVQHALRMAPNVVCLVRANFLWGTERYQHVLRFAHVVRMAVLVHRPSFHGPAVEVDGKGGQHEMMVLWLRRKLFDREQWEHFDKPRLEFWTDDWRVDP